MMVMMMIVMMIYGNDDDDGEDEDDYDNGNGVCEDGDSAGIQTCSHSLYMFSRN